VARVGVDYHVEVDGHYYSVPGQHARVQVDVVLDDAHRRDLLEVLDDRHGSRSTIVTSQLPIEHGTPPSATPRWPTPSSTAWFTIPTSSS